MNFTPVAPQVHEPWHPATGALSPRQTRRTGQKNQAAFTLLEVMVAVAILGLSLTAIFSAQAGTIRMATRSERMGMATLLARCKMLEVEELVANEGFPAVDKSGSDKCCEGGELDDFRCDWEIKLVVLPDTMFNPDEDEEEEKEGATEEDQNEGPAPSPLAAAGIPLGVAATPDAILSGGAGMGLAAIAMQTVYPILKPAFEQQIRRATVTVRWKEGDREKSFDVHQYLVAAAGVAPQLANPDEQNGTGTGTGTNVGTGAGKGK